MKLLVGSNDPAFHIDGAERPFGNAHVLSTQRAEPDAQAAHNCPAVDGPPRCWRMGLRFSVRLGGICLSRRMDGVTEDL